MIVRYEIEFWNDETREIESDSGIAARGNDIGEIVNNLYDYYGKEDVASLKIYQCEDIMTDYDLREMMKIDT